MKEYYNFKIFYWVVLLGLIDANYRFIWASLEAPGNTLKLYCKWENIARTSNWGKWRRNTTNYSWWWCLPFAFLDDETIWRCCINTRESLFWFPLSRARMVTEGTFSKLKGRFRVLHLSANVIKKLWK